MTRNRLVGILVIAVLAIAAGVGFAVTRGGDHGAGHMNGNGMNAHDMSGSTGAAWSGPMMDMGGMPGMTMDADNVMAMSDQAFLAMMIPHHQMAVDMARIELKRGKDPEVLKMARAVVTDQEGEISQMQGWYRSWFGEDPPQVPMSGSMMMMGMSMDMGELESTKEPDRVFLRMMIPHHAGALLMADAVLAGDPRNEVADLARRIVAAQSNEIGDMQRVRERIAPPLG
ncbi:MAG: DUF305 domain-containing protein [Thermoleophilia bacterium]